MLFQALAVWQWSNFFHSHVHPAKTPVRINMDETAVRLCPSMRGGHLTKRAREQKRTPKSLTMDVTRAQMRGSMSLLCFVTDDAAVQAALPQILLVNKRFAPAHLAGAIRASVNPPAVVWIVDKSWTTARLMHLVLAEVHKAFAPWRETHQIILSADAYRAHISPSVWRTAAGYGMMYLVIPAKMTWALQPCDTHVFAKLKHRFAIEVQAAIVRTTDGKPTTAMVIAAIDRAVQAVVVNGNYQTAFADLGLTGTQSCVSKSLLVKLELTERPHVPNALPTLSTLMTCFPKGSSLPIDSMFKFFLPRAAPATGRRRIPWLLAAPQARAHVQPWLGRLRSSSALGPQDSLLPADPATWPGPMLTLPAALPPAWPPPPPATDQAPALRPLRPRALPQPRRPA